MSVYVSRSIFSRLLARRNALLMFTRDLYSFHTQPRLDRFSNTFNTCRLPAVTAEAKPRVTDGWTYSHSCPRVCRRDAHSPVSIDIKKSFFKVKLTASR